MMKNKSNNYITQFLEYFGFVQIILVIIKLCGGLKEWPIEAVLLPAIVVASTLLICIVISFVIIVIALISKNNKE